MDYEEIPSDLRPIYKNIDNEVKWIHAKWKVYNQLFAVEQEQIDILNRTASLFFRIVQQTFFEDTLLGISRLTDPAETFGKKNRCLALLIIRFEDLGLSDLCITLKDNLENINTLCVPFREWRNKKISHSDLNTALKVSSDPLPGISRKDVENTLLEIRNFMNNVNSYFDESHTLYEHFITFSGGDILLGKLKLAEEYEKLKMDKFRSKINNIKNRKGP